MSTFFDDDSAEGSEQGKDFGGLAVDGGTPAGKVCVGENDDAAASHVGFDANAVRRIGGDVTGLLVRSLAGLNHGRGREQ